jgi:hypothetical protein
MKKVWEFRLSSGFPVPNRPFPPVALQGRPNLLAREQSFPMIIHLVFKEALTRTVEENSFRFSGYIGRTSRVGRFTDDFHHGDRSSGEIRDTRPQRYSSTIRSPIVKMRLLGKLRRIFNALKLHGLSDFPFEVPSGRLKCSARVAN